MTAPRDPRTKADAIREPRPGDRWDTGIEVRTVMFSSESIKRHRLVWTDGRFTIRDTRKSFQRWTKNAEFLGGADE